MENNHAELKKISKELYELVNKIGESYEDHHLSLREGFSITGEFIDALKASREKDKIFDQWRIISEKEKAALVMNLIKAAKQEYNPDLFNVFQKILENSFVIASSIIEGIALTGEARTIIKEIKAKA